MKKIAPSLFLLFYCQFAKAQTLPKLGNDTLIDVACWNIEWFGDVSNGPTNEALQFSNVLAVMNQTGMDVWAVEEMSSSATFASLTSQLSGFSSTNSTFSQTQKMCLFWKNSMFEFISSQHILTSYNYDFASRPPLMVTLKTIVDTAIFKPDTFYFIVLHMKAQSESDDAGRLQSYTRRKNASGWLKTYLETTLLAKKYFVLGDWNDDLINSIYSSSYPTPFKNFLDAGYLFLTKPLCDAGKKSYAFGSSMIDHIMISDSLRPFYLNNSCNVFDNIGSYILNASSNTSDHYLVYSKFLNNRKPITIKDSSQVGVNDLANIESFKIFPNPSKGKFSIENNSNAVLTISLLDYYGKELLLIDDFKSGELDFSRFAKGYYFLKIKSKNSISYINHKLILCD